MLRDEPLFAASVLEVLLGEMVEPIAQLVVDYRRRFEADGEAGVLGADAEVGVVVTPAKRSSKPPIAAQTVLRNPTFAPTA